MERALDLKIEEFVPSLTATQLEIPISYLQSGDNIFYNCNTYKSTSSFAKRFINVRFLHSLINVYNSMY